MNELCQIIKDTAKPNFLNIKTSIQTYDRDALCCGAPCWRWVYHALHSADKWFINPNDYQEPPFHEEGMDNPDNPCTVILSDDQLLAYLESIEEKTMKYLDSLTDEMLYEKPINCRYTRMELVLRQFRHISFRPFILKEMLSSLHTFFHPGRPVYSQSYIHSCIQHTSQFALFIYFFSYQLQEW